MLALLKQLIVRRSEPVTIVSGLPRSGTSMAMRMLAAGGVEPLTDMEREADEDNPLGYFEFERVKQLKAEDDKSWVRCARGRSLKVISYLLTELPDENRYKVIFLRRHTLEVIASQNRMLQSRNEPPRDDDTVVETYFEDHLRKVRIWLAGHPNFEVLELDYADVVSSPKQAAKRIRKFLGLKMDVDRMAGAVDPSLYRNRVGRS